MVRCPTAWWRSSFGDAFEAFFQSAAEEGVVAVEEVVEVLEVLGRHEKIVTAG